MATQTFQRNLLNLYGEGGKNVTLVCFLWLLKREREKRLTLAAYSLCLEAFLPVTLSEPLGSNTQADPNIHVE